jgi:hypothetical protein
VKNRHSLSCRESAAARLRAAQAEIEALLRQLVGSEQLGIFAYRWAPDAQEAGRQQYRLNLYFEDRAGSLAFDIRELLGREPEFWKRTVPCRIRDQVRGTSA